MSDSVRQAKKDALAPKSLPGMGAYAAKVQAAGLEPTAEATDVVVDHPVFASALNELGLLPDEENPEGPSSDQVTE